MITEVALDDEKSLATGLGQLVSFQVGLGRITDIHPGPERIGRDRISRLGRRTHKPVDISGGGVELRKVGRGILVRSVHHGWANSSHIKRGLLSRNEIPSRTFGQGFSSRVCCRARSVLLSCLFVGQWVPISLGVHMARPIALGDIDNGSEGGSDNNPAHIGSILFNRGKEVIGALDCRPEKIVLVVVDLNLERRGRVDDALDTLGGFIEGIRGPDVRYNGETEPVHMLGECAADLVGRFLGTDGSTNSIAGLKEGVDNVRGHKARGTGDQDGFSRHDRTLVRGLLNCYLRKRCTSNLTRGPLPTGRQPYLSCSSCD